jgi:pyruvate dehydrogenase E2 component (dihydrolipoamide acetyltransferase)
MSDVIMPKMGDAMDEGVIVQWLKNVGDTVGPDDAILEIETDKSNVQVEAGFAGILQQIKFKAGETVPVGQVIAVIGADAVAPGASTPETVPAPVAAPKADAAPSASAPKPVAKTEPASTPSAPLVVSAPKDFKPYASFVGAFPTNMGGSASLVGEPVLVEGEAGDRVKATPVARAMAQANNLDLAALRGTGPLGGIGKNDVEAALTNGSGPSTRQPTIGTAGSDEVEVQEYNAMRRTIAKRLTESKSTIPHFYVTAELDMEAFMLLREQVNANAGEGQPKVSMNDLLIKATAVALVENPVVNASFADNKRYIKKAVNIGVAVSMADGLIVPVVRHCESKSARQIARETRPLIENARSGKLAPADYTGGTFTITNLGSLTPDVENFAAIINPGEGAILAVSSIRRVPAVVGDEIVPRKRMKVTLCADHRVTDGAAGALFLQSLKRIVENPVQILA